MTTHQMMTLLCQHRPSKVTVKDATTAVLFYFERKHSVCMEVMVVSTVLQYLQRATLQHPSVHRGGLCLSVTLQSL